MFGQKPCCDYRTTTDIEAILRSKAIDLPPFPLLPVLGSIVWDYLSHSIEWEASFRSVPELAVLWLWLGRPVSSLAHIWKKSSDYWSLFSTEVNGAVLSPITMRKE